MRSRKGVQLLHRAAAPGRRGEELKHVEAIGMIFKRKTVEGGVSQNDVKTLVGSLKDKDLAERALKFAKKDLEEIHLRLGYRENTPKGEGMRGELEAKVERAAEKVENAGVAIDLMAYAFARKATDGQCLAEDESILQKMKGVLLNGATKAYGLLDRAKTMMGVSIATAISTTGLGYIYQHLFYQPNDPWVVQAPFFVTISVVAFTFIVSAIESVQKFVAYFKKTRETANEANGLSCIN